MSFLWLLNLITFLSAFLLFQLEFIIAKIILPLYGGSFAVWGACVVFFQALLLAGYAHAHYVIKKVGIERYRYIHLFLSFLPAVFFLNGFPWIMPPTFAIPFTVEIFIQLLKSIGLIFFVLSTMSIVHQTYAQNAHLPKAANPYVLYGFSNLGSFAALLSYPFGFELFFDLTRQVFFWQIGYGFLVFLQLAAFLIIKIKKQEAAAEPATLVVSSAVVFRWLALGAAGTILFLSVTNVTTSEIAPMPLLWMVPLAIYLLSFVISFRDRPWHPRWVQDNASMFIRLAVLFFFLLKKNPELPVSVYLLISYGLLFMLCLSCQHQLYHLRPKARENLGLFYVIFSLGSFLGGVLVSWVMPLVSSSFVEYLIGLGILVLGLMPLEPKWQWNRFGVRMALYAGVVFIIWYCFLSAYSFFPLLLVTYILLYIVQSVYGKITRSENIFFIGIVVIVTGALVWDVAFYQQLFVKRHRNYYGVYKVYDKAGVRYMAYGETIHGAQFLDHDKRQIPLTYFHPTQPVGEIFTSPVFEFKRVAIVGLGAGALAAYATSQTEIDYFELDPDVLKLAENHFTYLRDTKGKVETIIGDARLSLAQAKNKSYDLIIIDAFSGDHIPAHLLTTEAISLYKSLLNEKGFVLFHISNRYLDLKPLLASNARNLGATACFKHNFQSDENYFSSVWAVIVWNEEQKNALIKRLAWQDASAAHVPLIRPWTDGYSNILSVLRSGLR